jgi:hypothetical protein
MCDVHNSRHWQTGKQILAFCLCGAAIHGCGVVCVCVHVWRRVYVKN